jgi:DNA-binding MarR family transcriptional regulator
LLSSAYYIYHRTVTSTEDSADAQQIYLFVQHLGRRLRAIDEEFGLSAARFSVLASLMFHGVSNVGLLATFENVRAPSMTRLVRDMERDGLVTRSADPGDGRGVLVKASPRGRALVKSVRDAKIALVREHLVTLDATTRARVRAAFAALGSLAEPADEGAGR